MPTGVYERSVNTRKAMSDRMRGKKLTPLDMSITSGLSSLFRLKK